MEPHVLRMTEELAQLSDRIKKLTEFTNGGTYKALPEIKRALMWTQLQAMEAYATTLETRLRIETGEIKLG